MTVLLAQMGVTGAARAEEAMPPPVPVTPMPATAPENPEPMSREMSTRWQVRPWVGGTTLRLGGLEQFPAASALRHEQGWTKAYGATLDSREEILLDAGFLHGADASFRLDPLVSVAARIARLESGVGRRVTRMSAGGRSFRDEWEFETSMLLVMGGAGFHLPLNRRTRLNVSLFLGTGLATVRIGHRTRDEFPGTLLFQEGSAVADGTAFIPEFAFEIEHDVSESLALGAGIGYRFGGIESFTLRHASNVNLLTSSGVESDEGTPLRNANRSLLTADYGGLVLVVHLTARM